MISMTKVFVIYCVQLYSYCENCISDEIVAEAKQKTLSIVQELISDLLDDVDKTILFQGEYQKAFKAHHQYPLFDLADILPDFLLGQNFIVLIILFLRRINKTNHNQ